MQSDGDEEEQRVPSTSNGDDLIQLDLTDDAAPKIDGLVQFAKRTPGKVSLMHVSAMHCKHGLIWHATSLFHCHGW